MTTVYDNLPECPVTSLPNVSKVGYLPLDPSLCPRSKRIHLLSISLLFFLLLKITISPLNLIVTYI